MTNHNTIYPLSAVRTLALYTQGLATRNGGEPAPTPDIIYDAVDRIGCVQIDTLQLVHRSHYLALWSRLGQYRPADFDRVAYGDDHAPRRLFEYWLKEACYIPLTEYRYRLPLMRFYGNGGSRWFHRWLEQPGNAELVNTVLARIREEGAQRSADFEHDDSRRGTWWDWKPAKRALEHLYNLGDLMITRREKFQRVYDLRERVLPDWVDTTEPTHEETVRHLLVRSARALGICQPMQAADYLRVRRTEARPYVEALIAAGEFIAVKSDLKGDLIVHRDNLPLLEQAAEGVIRAERTTFLSPFDNLFWARGRDKQFWNFEQVLEAYKPGPQRRWGYFCLPILHREQLVGRLDPKLDRKTSTLHLKALYLEPDIQPEPELVREVAAALRDFMAFHGAKDLAIARSEPKDFGKKLLRALG